MPQTKSQLTRTIAVDLDGTLVHSDMLLENLFLFFRSSPFQFYKLLFWLAQGKASFKRKLADAVVPTVDRLPYDEDLLEWLKAQRQAGASLILATGSDYRIAQRVADHLGIFDEALGTQMINLTSENKRLALVERFGEGGFEYVGNSRADFEVWQSASLIHVANPERGVLAGARERGTIGEIFSSHTDNFRTVLKAMR
ncbi:MAG: haloacid dehalogenase-like hydrolase, partial [Sneathiella sp.]